MHIEEVFHGDVRPDGLAFAGVFAWPEAIHLGHGEVLPIVDERVSEDQRKAILPIMSGQDSEPGADVFQVFSTTLEKVHDPLFRPIEFTADLEACEGSFSVPDVVTGKARFGSGAVSASGPIGIHTEGRHVHLARLHMNGAGLIR